ncbi:MAG: hypothetical protein ACJ8AH_18980 [Stellaceae bacterium]
MAKHSTPLDAIISLTETVRRDWTKQRKAEERNASASLRRRDRLTRVRKVTIKDAAFDVMEDAYLHASSNGTLPVNARQIYYAARRQILHETGRDSLESGYFLQTLLRDYMATYDCDNWRINWDARGHFSEPHTRRVISLGTSEVLEYLDGRLKPGAPKIDTDGLYPTLGPENRYETVLFIEKEGFDPQLEAALVADRFDIAMMSTKGMSVSAARLLLDHLALRGVTKVLVLHDFDVSGFSIFGTLGTSSRVHRFRNQIPLVDIGLRLPDVDGLLSERYATKNDWSKVSATLRRHGASTEEIAFLRTARVELNALTSGDFIAFLERKFEQHGVAKVLPDADTLERHARRIIERRLVDETLRKAMPGISKRVAAKKLPKDLGQRIAAALRQDPELSWDGALPDALDDI